MSYKAILKRDSVTNLTSFPAFGLVWCNLTSCTLVYSVHYSTYSSGVMSCCDLV